VVVETAARWKRHRRLEEVGERVEEELEVVDRCYGRGNSRTGWSSLADEAHPAAAVPEGQAMARAIPVKGSQGAQPAVPQDQLVALQRNDEDVDVEGFAADDDADGAADAGGLQPLAIGHLDVDIAQGLGGQAQARCCRGRHEGVHGSRVDQGGDENACDVGLEKEGISAAEARHGAHGNLDRRPGVLVRDVVLQGGVF